MKPQEEITTLVIIVVLVLALAVLALVSRGKKETEAPSPEEETCPECGLLASEVQDVMKRMFSLFHCRGLDPGVTTLSWIHRHRKEYASALGISPEALADVLDHESDVCATAIAEAKQRREKVLQADKEQQTA